ncbi:TerC/Alx family metal homeostasis membrane protein [Helicobacter sp. 23-1044]
MSDIKTAIIFAIFVIVALMIDFFAHRKDEKISLKSASIWSVFWIAVSIAFGIYLYYAKSAEMAHLFFAGYILEKSLSVDNLFVIMAIFSWFKIPDGYRHRVLYFGILGAIVFRLIFVVIGSELFALSHWVQIIFGAIILWTAFMMLKSNDDDEEIEDYSNHLAYRFVHKYFSVFPKMVGHNFFVSKKVVDSELAKNPSLNFVNKGTFLIATPLFLCLCVIEVSDVMFAFDSVPAVIAISQEPLIIYSAMIFAILGLRTLYFMLEALKDYLAYLEKSVIVLLFFIAVKLINNALHSIYGISVEISSSVSLYVIAGVLICGVLLSIFARKKEVA